MRSQESLYWAAQVSISTLLLHQSMTAAFCREADQKRQAIALEKQQAAEAKERELAAQRAQREAERQALRRLQKNFGVRMEGSVAVDKPPKVTKPAFLSLMLHEKKRTKSGGKETPFDVNLTILLHM